MTPDEARSLAVAIARRIGVIEDPLYVEERNFRTVVVFPHYVAWVAHDELGEGKLTLERKILRLLSSRLAVRCRRRSSMGGASVCAPSSKAALASSTTAA